MKARFKGRTNANAIYVKEIHVRTKDGNLVTLSRNITEYTIDNGYYDMTWRGCYIEGARGHDFSIPASMFKDAEIVEIVLNENAPRKYDIWIDSWVAIYQ